MVGGSFLVHGGSDAQKEEWLPKIAGGETVIAFAFAEPQGRFNYADLTTTAKKQGASYVLSGQKAVVLGAPWADQLIVTARTAGGQRDAKGVSVFLVDKKVERRRHARLSDRRRTARVGNHVRERRSAGLGAYRQGRSGPGADRTGDGRRPSPRMRPKPSAP